MDVLQNSFFYTISTNFNRLAPVTKKKSIHYLYQSEFCTCSHFFNNIITAKPLPMEGIFVGSKEVEIWGAGYECSFLMPSLP
jgi:hypothetical protein